MMDVDNAEVQQSLIPHAEHNENQVNQTWNMFIDGSLTRDGSGIGIVLKSLEGIVIEQAVQLGFVAFNNELEYEVLVIGLKKARILSVKDLVIQCDS